MTLTEATFAETVPEDGIVLVDWWASKVDTEAQHAGARA